MTDFLEFLPVLFAVSGVLLVAAPVVLCFLLARRLAPRRPLRCLLIVVGLTLVWGPAGLGLGVLAVAALQRRWAADPQVLRNPADPAAGTVGRRWSALVADAVAARDRFHRAVEAFADGPLRVTLRDAATEVDAAVHEARRLAEQGDRTDRAHQEVVRALQLQHRRRRGSHGPPVDLQPPLEAARRAQIDSAQRLAAAVRRDLCQLQLVVARIHELTAHTLELATVTQPTAVPAAASVADRLAALRVATDEVERAAAV